MAEQHVVGDKKGSIYYITLNRPDKRNALSPEMLIQISDIVETLVQDPEIRAVIVNGEGSVFSAGVDLNSLAVMVAGWSMTNSAGGGALIRMDIHKFQQYFNRLESIEIPILCAMHGGAFGMALELALACDIRLMSEDCTWGLPEAQFGLIADLGGTARLAKTIGSGRAMEVLMTGGRFSPRQALEWHLVNHVYSTREELYAGAEKIATSIAKMAPLAVGAFKRIIKRGEGVNLLTHLDMEVVQQSIMMQSEDFKEGMRALVEKRGPIWKGK